MSSSRLQTNIDTKLKLALQTVIAERKAKADERGRRGIRISDRTIIEEALKLHPEIQRALRKLEQDAEDAESPESRLAA